jgi:ketosteroid isomerase-like protein
MQRMDADAFRGWLERYFAAWVSNDPAEVTELFSKDAVYSYGPFRDEARGRDEIVRRWVQGGAQPGLSTWFESLTVQGERGVANWRVAFDEGDERVELDGILILDFDADGRCILHREWYDLRRTGL